MCPLLQGVGEGKDGGGQESCCGCYVQVGFVQRQSSLESPAHTNWWGLEIKCLPKCLRVVISLGALKLKEGVRTHLPRLSMLLGQHKAVSFSLMYSFHDVVLTIDPEAIAKADHGLGFLTV